MRHQQAAQFALGLFRRFERALMLAPRVVRAIGERRDLSSRR
jgi:hypothetical protein